ncbi:MAG: DUF4384 domain-containing protein [Bryobacteraceae bacterium]
MRTSAKPCVSRCDNETSRRTATVREGRGSGILGVVCAVCCLAQEPPRARDLFYNPARAQNAAATATLGLRYSLLKMLPDGAFAEVDPYASFRDGDAVRVGVEANQSGYLYVIHRGTSDTWYLMIDSVVPVEKGKRYEVPGNGLFRFRGQPGIEKLFLVLSRAPEPSIESVIHSLQKQTAAPGSKPARRPDLRITNVPLDDSLLMGLRQASARDLIFEKTADGSTEKAFYVVNQSSDGGSRVVVDINLRHE